MEFSVRRPSPPNTYSYVQEIHRNVLIPPVGYLGKYTAHNDYTEEEVRRISVAAVILVSATVLEVGGALAPGRVVPHICHKDALSTVYSGCGSLV